MAATNEAPATRRLLTEEPGCCENFDAHAVGPITLEGGKKYYTDVLMKESGGGDYVYVAWKTPTNSAADWQVIPGTSLWAII